MRLPGGCSQPGAEGGAGQQLEAAGDVLDPERAAGRVVQPAQLAKQRPGPGAVREPCQLGQAAGVERLAGQEQSRLQPGQFLGPDMRSRFLDDLGRQGGGAEQPAAAGDRSCPPGVARRCQRVLDSLNAGQAPRQDS
jgi:hypothetical protein